MSGMIPHQNEYRDRSQCQPDDEPERPFISAKKYPPDAYNREQDDNIENHPHLDTISITRHSGLSFSHNIPILSGDIQSLRERYYKKSEAQGAFRPMVFWAYNYRFAGKVNQRYWPALDFPV